MTSLHVCYLAVKTNETMPDDDDYATEQYVFRPTGDISQTENIKVIAREDLKEMVCILSIFSITGMKILCKQITFQICTIHIFFPLLVSIVIYACGESQPVSRRL